MNRTSFDYACSQSLVDCYAHHKLRKQKPRRVRRALCRTHILCRYVQRTFGPIRFSGMLTVTPNSGSHGVRHLLQSSK